jgi:penicillin-binding protein 1A
MIFMMNKVVEEGTGKRAQLDGIRAAGKTGTTNAYRDAWFMGYTGSLVCGVWVGNDDYSPLNRMTGGSVPAMIWHDVMTYAHRGIEMRNLPGLQNGPATTSGAVAENKSTGAEPPFRPMLLTRRGADVLQRLERMMENASQALASASAREQRGAALDQSSTLATAADRNPDRPPASGN